MRAINGVALLADYAVTRGLAMPDILRGTGIREQQLQDPNAEISLDQELRLTRNVVTGVHNEPGLGLMAGLLCHPPSFGVLGFAVMSSPTLRHAADIGVRYADLWFTIARHALVEHGDELWLIRDDHGVPADLRRFSLERDFSAIATIQQDLVPMKVPTLRVEVTVEPHPVYEMFATMLGVDKITFGQPRSLMAWQRNTLDVPLPQANTATARFYEQQCADIVQRRRSRDGVSGRVRDLLIRHGGVTDQSRIAADMDISVRTLRRRLADEGTTFRELSNETIGMLAEELLVAGLTVENVADRLGYSSVSAFTAAFRSWKGQPPGHFARVHRGRAIARV